MKIDKKCPKCGSKKIRKDFNAQSLWHRCCVDCGTILELEEATAGQVVCTKDEDWEKYQKEGIPCGNIFEMYLYAKNDNNEIVLDISPENIKRCEEIYNQNPQNKDALYRILILKVALGEETKELLDKFLKATEGQEYEFLCFIADMYREFPEPFEPYFSYIKRFLIWFLEKRTIALRNSGFSHDWDEIRESIHICEFVDVQAIFDILNIDTLLKDVNLFQGGWGGEEVVMVAYAEFCYKEERWFDAFRLYELALDYYGRFFVNGGKPDWFDDDSFLGYCSDFMPVPPTIEEIKDRHLECLEKIFEHGDASLILDLLFKRLSLKESLWEKERDMERKEEDLGKLLRIYSIFQEVIKGDYIQAYNKWKSWEDKKNIKFIGLKRKSVEEYLKNLKEGKGNKKDNLSSIFKNSLVEDYALISDFETKLREFILTNLIKCYRTKKDAWFCGIPEKIRIDAARKQQQQRLDDSKKWNLLEFSDYPEIIKGNSKIFRPFFIVDKADNQKKQEELFGFLDRIVPLRNNIAHNRILSGRERGELKNYCSHFDRIYTNWQKSFKKRK